MPRLSLWNPVKSNNYRYIDRLVKEQYVVGGTDLYVHKYLGPANTGPSVDKTQPQILVPSPTAIQDLMFVETRDRVYDTNIYRIRGHYNVANLDFDLSQFGLFLTNDIIYVTVHYNDMIDLIGRKFLVGDVFELPHLTDYHPLNETVPIGLRRYYQITDANFASEGFSVTWYPHLWRVKCEPMINSQQFTDIMNEPVEKDNYMGNWDPATTYKPGYVVSWGGKNWTPIVDPVPPGTLPNDPAYWREDTGATTGDLISAYKKNLEINNAIIEEARRVVPLTGYARSQLYLVPTTLDGEPAPPINLVTANPGGPSLGTGTLSLLTSAEYRNPSAVIRVRGGGLKAGDRLILGTGVTATAGTDGGSGRIAGDPAVTVRVMPLSSTGSLKTGPYGTADNTYATADQYPRFTVTAQATPINSTVIQLLEWTDDLAVGLTIASASVSANGTVISVFPPGTRITALNRARKIIRVSAPTIGALGEGAPLTVAGDFTGTISSDMDWRSDCDPRFQYIRRASPRSFGYINGYLTGTAEAPNGEPAGAGDTFPSDPQVGDYFLRTDYLPQLLFRWDGALWREISRNVRTATGTGADSQTQLSRFINDTGTTELADGQTVPTRQSLSNALRVPPT